MTRILIVQRYIPQYRVAFFEELLAALTERSHDVSILYSDRPSDELAARGDARRISRSPSRVRQLRLGNRPSLLLHSSGARALFKADVVVVEHANRIAILHLAALLRLLRRGPLLILWGHGPVPASTSGRAAAALRRTILRRCDGYIAYTPGVARSLLARSDGPSHVWTIGNSAPPPSREIVRPTSRGGPFRIVYLGSLYASKGLDFLIDAFDALAESSGVVFKVTVIGGGPLLASMEVIARDREWLECVGPAFDNEKWAVLEDAEVGVIPGLVGLPAVDLLYAGLPIVTRVRPDHSPEFEYLVDGENARVLDPDCTPLKFATTAVAMALALREGKVSSSSVRRSVSHLSISNMVDNFVLAVEGSIEARQGDS